MTPTTIKINRLFSTAPYENIDLGMEATIDPGETYEEAVVKAHQQIVEAFHKVYPPITVNPEYAHLLPTQQPPLTEIKVDKIPEDELIAVMIGDIGKCTTLEGDDGLYSFKGFVARTNKPAVTAAYDLKLKELTNGM